MLILLLLVADPIIFTSSGMPPRDDVTPPVTTIMLSGTLGDNGWYISSVRITLTAVDNESGVNATFYRFDGGSFLVYTAPFDIAWDGVHQIFYYSVDNAGNVEPWHVQEVKIDTTVPTYNSSQHVSLNEVCFGVDSQDHTSGVNRVEFFCNGELVKIDSTPPYCYILHHPQRNISVKGIAYNNAGLSCFILGPTPKDITHVKRIVTDINSTNTLVTFRAVFTMYDPANRHPFSLFPLPRLLLPRNYTFSYYDGEVSPHWIDIYLFPLPT